MLLPSRTDDEGHLLPTARSLAPSPVPVQPWAQGRRRPAIGGSGTDDNIPNSYAGCDASAARSARSRGPSILAE